MLIALVLYPNFTMLDIIGPFQVFADIPDTDLTFVTSKAGPIPEHTGRTGLVATKTLDEFPNPDVVIVPGGLGETSLDDGVVRWLRKVHPTTTWTTSVCTGSIYLAAAGILDGLDATSHWTRKDRLESLGAHYTEERVVERGKIITAAGVSSGIDMALTLVARVDGEDMAKLVQLGIEYDPQPPFDTGSPRKAPPELVEFAQASLGDTLSDESVAATVGSRG